MKATHRQLRRWAPLSSSSSRSNFSQNQQIQSISTIKLPKHKEISSTNTLVQYKMFTKQPTMDMDIEFDIKLLATEYYEGTVGIIHIYIYDTSLCIQLTKFMHPHLLCVWAFCHVLTFCPHKQSDKKENSVISFSECFLLLNLLVLFNSCYLAVGLGVNGAVAIVVVAATAAEIVAATAAFKCFVDFSFRAKISENSKAEDATA